MRVLSHQLCALQGRTLGDGSVAGTAIGLLSSRDTLVCEGAVRI